MADSARHGGVVRKANAVRSADSTTASARSNSSKNTPFISFALLPAFGHVYPVMPLVEATQAAGARVQVAVGRPFNENLPMSTVLGTDVDPAAMSVPDLTREKFPAVVDDMPTRWVPAYFGVMHALPTVTALRRAWRADRPDLVVYDPANPGAAVVADELGIPAVLFSVFHYFPPMLNLPAVTRRALDHPEVAPWEPVADLTYRNPYVDPVPAALQQGPIADYPEVIPIRTVPWENRATDLGAVPSRRSGRPLIYLTLGTVVGTAALLRGLILEAAEVGDVIASTGPGVERSELAGLPGNVILREFVPTRAVMSVADLVVHHGGMGTTLAAAAHGIPQLIVPQVGDQFANAQAVARAGIGQALIGPRADGAVSAALTTLQDDDYTREAARSVARSIAATPGPDRVADLLISRAARGLHGS
ncbi:glycosyltransferase [Skermania piniformis]|nr:glycosyltransferase [Skermania piniformis]